MGLWRNASYGQSSITTQRTEMLQIEESVEHAGETGLLKKEMEVQRKEHAQETSRSQQDSEALRQQEEGAPASWRSRHGAVGLVAAALFGYTLLAVAIAAVAVFCMWRSKPRRLQEWWMQRRRRQTIVEATVAVKLADTHVTGAREVPLLGSASTRLHFEQPVIQPQSLHLDLDGDLPEEVVEQDSPMPEAGNLMQRMDEMDLEPSEENDSSFGSVPLNSSHKASEHRSHRLSYMFEHNSLINARKLSFVAEQQPSTQEDLDLMQGMCELELEPNVESDMPKAIGSPLPQSPTPCRSSRPAPSAPTWV